MKLVFRVDASTQIGIGHLMRCLTLANAMQARGATSMFVSAIEHQAVCELIREAGHELKELPPSVVDFQPEQDSLAHAHWLGRSQPEDAALTLEMLKGFHPDLLIVDHYGIDQQWHRAMRPVCQSIMVIDDIADRQHDCDLLLDQNLVANSKERYADRAPARARTLLGPHYALLQPEYVQERDALKPRRYPARDIFSYFGNADRANLAGLTVRSFLSLGRKDVHLHAVVNPASPDIKKITQLASGSTNISLYSNLPSLAPLMRKCDLAIGAGGATSWERCCLGLPAIVITLADNQIPLTTKLNKDGYVNWLGDQANVTEKSVTDALGKALEERNLESWSAKCMTLVDGKGTDRVCSAIMEL